MSGSKSTDKLEALEDIIKSTFNNLSMAKRDSLTELTITWVSIDVGEEELVACPNLTLKFT